MGPGSAPCDHRCVTPWAHAHGGREQVGIGAGVPIRGLRIEHAIAQRRIRGARRDDELRIGEVDEVRRHIQLELAVVGDTELDIGPTVGGESRHRFAARAVRSVFGRAAAR